MKRDAVEFDLDMYVKKLSPQSPTVKEKAASIFEMLLTIYHLT